VSKPPKLKLPEGNVHTGHRGRVRDTVRQDGLDTLPDHKILEFLLLYAIPRRDVNPLAHHLVNHFGNLAAVLDAKPEELMAFPGIGERAALLLTSLPIVNRKYLQALEKPGPALGSTSKVVQYLAPLLSHRKDERVYLLCMDGMYRVTACPLLVEGTVGSAGFSVRKTIETALFKRAASVVLAHNHPGGTATPTAEDIAATRTLLDALASVEIRLVDHIIIAQNGHTSIIGEGYI
jgi:DNA repair protein RadC